jgi:Uma2 family endonuclease
VRGNLAIVDRSNDGDLGDRDQVIVMTGVPWSSYDALVRARGERPQPRLAYLDGTLEIMTTGLPHGLDDSLLSRLVEAYAEEAGLELNAGRNTTFRKKAKKAGLEPDECYWIGRITEVPALAIEIVHASGGIDKLEIYRRLGVGEVWFWIESRLELFVLGPDGFHARARSTVLRGIDLGELERLCDPANHDRQTTTVRAYRRSLRKRISK